MRTLSLLPWVNKIVERATEELNANDAATRMRDRCLEKVREFHDQWIARMPNSDDPTFKYHYRTRADAAIEIRSALQSLTLEGEQEKR